MDDRGRGQAKGLALKYCSGCQTEKDLAFFSKNRAMRDGVANWCKECHKGVYTSQANLERRTKRRDEDHAHALLIECRARARKRGLDFDLVKNDLIIPDICPVLGISLFRTRGKITDNTPTVDRVCGELGYVRGNIAVISWKANRIKTDCDDPAVFEAIAKYIRTSWKSPLGKESQSTVRGTASDLSILAPSAGQA